MNCAYTTVINFFDLFINICNVDWGVLNLDITDISDVRDFHVLNVREWSRLRLLTAVDLLTCLVGMCLFATWIKKDSIWF